MDGEVCLRCKGKWWRWRWWDQIQAIFLNLFYFTIKFVITPTQELRKSESLEIGITVVDFNIYIGIEILICQNLDFEKPPLHFFSQLYEIPYQVKL